MNFVLHGLAVSARHHHRPRAPRLQRAPRGGALRDRRRTRSRRRSTRFDARDADARRQELARARRRSIPADAPAEFAAFLNLHRMILDDSALSQAPRELIRERRCNAEWALVQQMEQLVGAVRARSRTRTCASARPDVRAGGRAGAEGARGRRSGAPSRAPRPRTSLIVVAHDLSPADMILFKRAPVRRLRHRRRRRHLAHRDRRAQPRTSRRSSACTTRAT